jgi:phosphate uptake regulator
MTDVELLAPAIEHLAALSAEAVRASIQAHATGTDEDARAVVEANRAVDKQVAHVAELSRW